MPEDQEPEPEELSGDAIEDLELTREEADDVRGGARDVSPPAGPIPIPYPNLPSKPPPKG